MVENTKTLTPEQILEKAKADAAAIIKDAEIKAKEDAAGIIAAAEGKAKADAANIVKAAEDKAQKLVTSPPVPDGTPVHAVPEEFVELRLPLAGHKAGEALFVGINGRSWRIMYGKTVKVPSYVRDFIEQQQAQEDSAALMIAELQSDGEE